MCDTRVDEMKHETRIPAPLGTSANATEPETARAADPYAVTAAAMLFMCNAGTSPVRKPKAVPAAAETRTDASKDRSSTASDSMCAKLRARTTVRLSTLRQ